MNKVDTPMCEGVKRALNSLCNVWMIFLHRNDHRDGEAQYRYGMNIRPRRVEIQFIDKLKILDDGSKIENRLAIIFKVFEL